MVRWMCGVELKDGLPSGGLRERLGVDDMELVLRRGGLRWCGHVLRGGNDDWVRGCVEYEVGGSGPGGTREDLERGCSRGLSST